MALDINRLEQDIKEMYDQLESYDNSNSNKSAEKAREFMAEQLADIINRFVKTGKVNDDGYVR